jgi:glycosyltransferase involved in cell wall biosynthesis
MEKKPRISVITASKNGARFLRETIESIQKQTFTDYEHVFVDSLSTDNTVEILKEYDHLRWISEPDRHADEGFYKAAHMSRGDLIMLCCVSDRYSDPDWFGRCVEVLDNDPEVSLVYGIPQCMKEDGTLGRIVCSDFMRWTPPQKMDFFPFWLGTFALCPEITFCVRAEVFRTCFPRYEPTNSFMENHALLAFNYHFNMKGYLPYFLPVVACYGRDHHDSNSRRLTKGNRIAKQQYWSAVIQYGNEVLSGKRNHMFRDGRSEVIRVIEPHELEHYRQKVLNCRINRRAYLGKKRAEGLRYHTRKLKILMSYLLFQRCVGH